jgi:peptide/nickel transport system substrate-binding protein
LAAASIAAAVALAGYRLSPAAPPKNSDPNPPPAEPMVVNVGEIGARGGRFVLAQTSDPRTFNTMMTNEQSSNEINNLMWASLVDYDYETGKPMPSLARSWEISADGTTYTWHLRRGARFSDGHPITSADVMFSASVAYDTTLHPVVQDVVKADGRPMDFSAPDSFTVVTRVARPYGQTIWAMSSLRVLPRHRMEAAYRAGTFASAYNVGTAPESLVTSGAFRLAQYVPKEKTVLERNPWWFRFDSKGQRLPYLDQVVFLIVPDQNTAALKFESGEVDAVDNVKPDDYQRYKSQQKAKDFTLYYVGPSLTANFIWFNLNTVRTAAPGKVVGAPAVSPEKYDWFRDPVFRRAVSKAIDRDNMIRGTYFGYAVKNWSTTTPGNPRWSSKDVVGDDYDPAGAKRLLASMGWKDSDHDGVIEDAQGRPVKFAMKTNADSDVRKSLAQRVAEDLAKVGIQVTVVPVQFNAMMTNLRQDFDYESMLLGIGAGIPPDPGQSRNIFHSTGLSHFWHIRQNRPDTPAEAEMDSLADAIARLSDDTVRHRIWRRIEAIMNQQNFFVWLPSQIIQVPVRNQFGNVHPQVVSHRILWNIERIFSKRAARQG